MASQHAFPAFTYRQVTSHLPSEPGSDQPVPTPSPRLPPRPPFPAPEGAAMRAKTGLMGRFGDAVDWDAAREGLSAIPVAQASPAPVTTAPSRNASLETRPGSPPQADRSRFQGKVSGKGSGKFLESGWASWYQRPGRTANGETYNPDKLTAAHRSLPFGTRIKVVNSRSGRSVIVRITDRTNRKARAKRGYAINLSRASAQKLGIVGIGYVTLYRMS